jgi:hypothetical protein
MVDQLNEKFPGKLVDILMFCKGHQCGMLTLYTVCQFRPFSVQPGQHIRRISWGNARGQHLNDAALLHHSTLGHNVSKSEKAFLIVGLGLLQRNEVNQLMELGHHTADVITGKAAVFHLYNHITTAGSVAPRLGYRWIFIPSDSDNYNTIDGSITLYRVSSGGSSGSSTTTKTETTTGKDGSVSRTETKKDGSSVTENKAADGSTGSVKTDKNGQTTAETKVGEKAAEDAKKNGEAVKAPVEVEATRQLRHPRPAVDDFGTAGRRGLERRQHLARKGTGMIRGRRDL